MIRLIWVWVSPWGGQGAIKCVMGSDRCLHSDLGHFGESGKFDIPARTLVFQSLRLIVDGAFHYPSQGRLVVPSLAGIPEMTGRTLSG